MRILFLSFYYEPDLSAGSFRAAALIRALLPLLPVGSHVDLLTTRPNRYSSFTVDAPEFEDGINLSIRRIVTPSHKSGMFDQSRSFLTYAQQVLSYTKNQKYDLVVATSSRLMTAVLGAYVARKQKAALYLDIRDIFVDTIKDVLPHWIAWALGPALAFLEHYAIGRADSVNLVSRGFERYFLKRYPEQFFTFYTNGIDKEFIENAPAEGASRQASHPYTILYAGNIGEGQGLHLILPSLSRAMCEKARFIVIGDGGRKFHLQKALDEAGVDNVTLYDPVDRAALARAYQEADVLFLHLNDYDAFRKVLPSKVFEYAAVGKPIWAGVAGYAAEFIKCEIENASIFPPGDVASAIRSFSALEMRFTPRAAFVQEYDRQRIMRLLANDIVTLSASRV